MPGLGRRRRSWGLVHFPASLESEGEAAVAGSVSATTSEETSDRATRSAKAQVLEESEAESEERPISALPRVPGGPGHSACPGYWDFERSRGCYAFW